LFYGTTVACFIFFRLLNRTRAIREESTKKAAAEPSDPCEFTTEVVKRNGMLGKLGMKKKVKTPVVKEGGEKPGDEEAIMDSAPAEDAPAASAPVEDEPASMPLEPEAAKEEEPAADDEDAEEEDPVDEREEEDPKDDELVAEESATEATQPAHEHDAVESSLPELEEREQPEMSSPLASVNPAGFLCGCMG
jgi:hypothetical protein